MFLATLLINTTIVVASSLTVQQMQMERAMEAHMMEMEKLEAAEDAPGGAVLGGIIGQQAGHQLEGAAIGAAVGGPINKAAEDAPEMQRLIEAEQKRLAEAEAELLREHARLNLVNDYPFAKKAPDKPGFVFSPHNNQVVDVREIPSGTLVQDPGFPPDQRKFFRVP